MRSEYFGSIYVGCAELFQQTDTSIYRHIFKRRVANGSIQKTRKVYRQEFHNTTWNALSFLRCPQWRICGKSPGGRPPPLILSKKKNRRNQKSRQGKRKKRDTPPPPSSRETKVSSVNDFGANVFNLPNHSKKRYGCLPPFVTFRQFGKPQNTRTKIYLPNRHS